MEKKLEEVGILSLTCEKYQPSMENKLEEVGISNLTSEICIELTTKSEEVEIPCLTCEICLEPTTHKKKFENKNRCAHPFCTDCIAKYIETKVEERVVEVPCPSLNCEELLDPLSCSRIIPVGLFEKCCDLLCKSAVLRCESAYCPFADCSVLILNECRRNIRRSTCKLEMIKSYTKCPNCKKLLCFQCNQPWHAGFGCDKTGEMRDENDILFGELVEKNQWKICLDSKYCVERNEGCQNIKCRFVYVTFLGLAVGLGSLLPNWS
ncbi:hypothetical protein NE237_030654 [Protea cynaroides]|uniref:Uncharacterized protein n=1 Tax=Protea cynaroides TaxID=273540 RepID=A0A9Q0JW95_9MAGN|nr:hypothetical protein NE237_030654 [Protea cynaroides]